MRILQIANKAPYPPNDGSSIAIYNISKGLLNNGARLHVLAINTKKHFKPDEQVPSDFREQAHYQSVYRNTDVRALGAVLNLFGNQSYFVSRFYFPEFKERLKTLLQEETFDIIHLEGIFMAVYIPLIRRYSKAKVVIRAHNVEYKIWERKLHQTTGGLKNAYLRLQAWRLKQFELDALRSADAIVPITPVDKELMEAAGISTRYFVSPSGVDLQRYHPNDEALEAQSVFHFGAMDWMPNVEAVEWFLEHCWPLIHAQLPQAKLYIAGRDMPKHLSARVHKQVVFIEKVKDALTFYHQKNIMVVPLLSGSGMRIKILEGLALGKAIVSTSIGAEGIPVTDGKNIYLSNTPQDFADRVVALLKHPEQRQALSREARLLAEKEFDNDRITKELLKFYQHLIHA